eukprot:187849-Prymnesium_polylepis.1
MAAVRAAEQQNPTGAFASHFASQLRQEATLRGAEQKRLGERLRKRRRPLARRQQLLRRVQVGLVHHLLADHLLHHLRAARWRRGGRGPESG